MGWLSGWSYRRAITITEQSGSTLTDYQVRIELNSSNFDFSKANADGSDIRFTADDGETLLPYWIEKWDNANQQAVIWVKVPSIPANSDVTIYMYYGNGEAEDESDGEAVFEFFDDFEETSLDANKWNSGKSSYTTLEVVNGELHIEASTRNEPLHVWVATKNSIPFPCRVRYKERVVNCEHSAWVRDIITDANSGFTYSSLPEPIMGYSPGDGTLCGDRAWFDGSSELISGVTTPDNTIQIIEIVAQSGDFRIKKNDTEIYSNLNSLSTTPTTTYWHFGIYKYYNGGNPDIYYDWIAVMKYAEQEPTVTVGSEEMPPVKYWDGSQWKDIKAIYYWDGSQWVKALGVHYWDGSQWIRIF